MSKLTKQGLRNSLYAMLEFGYKQCEKGHNIQAAKEGALECIERLVAVSDNCPEELFSFTTKNGKLKQA